MTEHLDVELHGHVIGRVTRTGVDDYRFEYTADWLSDEAAIPLSHSLPLRARPHQGRVVANFIDNLLPDSPDVRERWATEAGLETTEPFLLLAEYGEDVAGAASFRRPGEPPSSERVSVDDTRIAERIRRLRADATAWHDEERLASGQFSLGGAQRKFSLARDNAGWWETRGSEPSTHIFKPQVERVPDGELVEYVVMRTARMLGIPTASVELFDDGDEHALVVERFDRRHEDGAVSRIHQEDLLQALGIARLRKYERDGGPGVDDLSAFLASHADHASLERYAASLMFAWIVLSADAHAKNHSVFIQPGGAQLTPLYDASSVLPYLGSDVHLDEASLLTRAAGTRLSVNFGATDRVGDVGAFELGRIARRCGLPHDHLLAITATWLYEIAGVVEVEAAALPARLQTDTVARLVEWMPIRARQAAESLGLSGLVES